MARAGLRRNLIGALVIAGATTWLLPRLRGFDHSPAPQTNKVFSRLRLGGSNRFTL